MAIAPPEVAERSNRTHHTCSGYGLHAGDRGCVHLTRSQPLQHSSSAAQLLPADCESNQDHFSSSRRLSFLSG